MSSSGPTSGLTEFSGGASEGFGREVVIPRFLAVMQHELSFYEGLGNHTPSPILERPASISLAN